MTNTNPILFDTNILVYNQDTDSQHFPLANQWHQKAIDGTIHAYIAHQNLVEFAAVMANPKHITCPLSSPQIFTEIEAYQKHSSFTLISPTPHTMTHFQTLNQQYPPKNPRHTFDLYLVATMFSHQITSILTLNTKNFKHISQIQILPLK